MKKPINADYSALTEKLNANLKALLYNANDRVRITYYKNNFRKDYTGNWSRDRFIINSVLKINPWTYEIKGLNGEKK